MQRYRAIIVQHADDPSPSPEWSCPRGLMLELRVDDFGRETCLLEGRPVSSAPLAGLGIGRHHHFDFTDASGVTHHGEVFYDATTIKQAFAFRYRYKLLIDGRDRCILEFFDPKLQGTCRYCGYSLAGIEPVLDERKCPECGRHTPRE